MRIRQRHAEEESAVNLMPLIDMVFLLLIFFLVATTFAQEERDLRVQLPPTGMPKPLSAPPQQLIINIQADGTAVVGVDTYAFEDLARLLVRAVRERPDREVLIRADERSLHLYFAQVASLCREVGIEELKVGYVIQAPKPVPVN